MAKEPLITRSSLRKHREKADREQTQTGDSEQSAHNVTRIPKATLTREQPLIQEQVPGSEENGAAPSKKRGSSFFRKEAKAPKALKKSRSVENQKSRELNGFLVRSIVVVCLLIVVVMLATFFL